MWSVVEPANSQPVSLKNDARNTWKVAYFQVVNVSLILFNLNLFI